MRFDLLEDLFGEHLVVRNGHGGKNGVLPGIETINLGDGDVETLAQAVFQTFDDMALLFQRMRCFNDNVERQYTDDRHFS